MSDFTEAQSIAAIASAPFIKHTEGGTPLAIIKQGHQIEDLSKYLAVPTHIMSHQRVNDEDSFVAYFTRFANINSTVFISDADNHRFKGVIDFHGTEDPDNCDHTVTYNCPTSTEWDTWKSNNKEVMSQVEFARFIESNLPDIVEPTGADLLEIVKTLEAKRKVEWKQGARLDNGDVQFQYVEETAGQATKGQMEIPQQFTLGIPVFINGAPYKIIARLRWRIDNDSKHLAIWYEMDRPHKTIEHAFKETQERIREALETYSIYNSNP